ncbi:DUF7709 family protein [Chromobacterium violaceum]|uniref:DUF7709 domain-containing protein n=1 Tax=Chromobacterium violaceum TaxID=536 RepID=A0A202BC03_CHRVL|nr:hypothetical protein [Chromobacterium violaceum]MBA8734534.1 hypothetical protein [Chromobacterium violaceum]OVE49077.1 hypothetical protein CBW21_07665 [Chromobacterium violaceum]
MKHVQHTEALSAINRKVIADGETLPAVKLRDGSTVQTGTVATMLVNIAAYNRGERGEVENQLELAVPTLFKVGLFDLFPPEEWTRGDNPGRKLVGELAGRWLAGPTENTSA